MERKSIFVIEFPRLDELLLMARDQLDVDKDSPSSSGELFTINRFIENLVHCVLDIDTPDIDFLDDYLITDELLSCTRDIIRVPMAELIIRDKIMTRVRIISSFTVIVHME